MSLSKQRVAERVAHGGHNIPTKDIERRLSRSLYNLLYSYSPICDLSQCFENSESVPFLIFEQKREGRAIHNQAMFDHIDQEARK